MKKDEIIQDHESSDEAEKFLEELRRWQRRRDRIITVIFCILGNIVGTVIGAVIRLLSE